MKGLGRANQRIFHQNFSRLCLNSKKMVNFFIRNFWRFPVQAFRWLNVDADDWMNQNSSKAYKTE
jgi:hypothetical protein